MAVLASSKKRSQVSESGRWKRHISSRLGEKPINSLTNLDLLMLRRDLEKQGLSPQTVHHCLSLLRRVLRKAIEWGGCGSDMHLPSFKGVMPKFDNRRQRFLNDEELYRLIHYLGKVEESKNWYNIALFAVNTGLRKGEIFDLRLCDINFNSRIATIMDTKSGHNRTVELNDAALSIALKKSCISSTGTRIFSKNNRRKCLVKRSGILD